MTSPIKRKVLTRISSVRFSNSQRSLFSGLLLKDSIHLKSTKIVVVVDIPTEKLPVEPAVGQLWEVQGYCIERQIPKNGFYIKESTMKDPERCELKMPSDHESLIRFMVEDPTFKGIGPQKARQLSEHFGSDLIRLATTGDRGAFKDILQPNSIDSLINGFERYKNLRHAQWLSVHGVPLSVQRRLFQAHGEESVDIIKGNPYTLVTFGVPFSQCETIAENKFGLTKEDPRRLAAAAEQALIDHCDNRHTVAAPEALQLRIQKILSTHDASQIGRALELAKEARFITYRPDKGLYHNTALHIMERVVAKRLGKISKIKTSLTERHFDTIRRVAVDLPYALTERQLDAVESSLSHGLSCITGGAGTGKTTVLRTTLHCYQLLGYDIKAMALSGRAAMRLHESINMETMTIAGFLRNVQIQDVPTLIVIDEASMLDLNLLYRIVIQSLPTTRILLCGDPDQLPPIGPGIPFSDIIRSRISSVIELDIVQRQDATTGIPEYSKDIRLGKIPELLSVGKIRFHEAHSVVDITEKCSQLLAESPRDSKIVAPTKDVTKTINRACQAAINPSGTALSVEIHGQIWNTEYKAGDPILFTRNDYDAGVQNGSLARLVSVQPLHEEELGRVRLDDTGAVLSLTKTFLDNMKLGYAMTLHKTQGSQVPRVIIALTESQLIDRSWVYTAITRSESEVHIVGAKSTFARAVIKESAHHMRKTYLRELLSDQA